MGRWLDWYGVNLMRVFLALLAAAAVASFAIFAEAREARHEVHTTTTCANTSTEMLDAEPGRTAALFVNDSTQVIWIKVNEDAVANEGIRLNANGGSYYVSDHEGNLDLEAVDCIVASGTGLMLVTEWGTY